MSIVHQQVIDQIVTQLQLITVAGGYNTGIGSNVNAWDPSKAITSEMPRVNVKDDSEIEISQQEITTHIWEMPVTIEVEAKGSTSMVDARKIIADIHAAIGTDLTLNSFAEMVIPGPILIEHFQDENKVVIVTVEITVTFATDSWSSDES